MRNKIISVAEAVDMIPDGATIMYGGFLGCGSAHHIIEALAQKGTKDLTIIGNDCGMATGPNGEEFYGVAKLVHNHQVKHVIATHVGMTPDVGTQGMVDKTLTVDLIPQGTLAEMIRAGGAGLGGVLTPTGVGTIVEDSPFCLGKQTIDGKEYLLMKACRFRPHQRLSCGQVWQYLVQGHDPQLQHRHGHRRRRGDRRGGQCGGDRRHPA